MSTKLYLIFYLLPSLVLAQHFNRSILDGKRHSPGDVLIAGKYTFLLMNDVPKGHPFLYKFDEKGNTLAHSGVGLNFYRFLQSSDLQLRPDGRLVVQGRYNDCDVNNETGNFFAAFDQNLNQLSFTAVSDSVGGDGQWLSFNGTDYIVNDHGVLVHLDSAFHPFQYDSLNLWVSSYYESIVLNQDSLLLSCTDFTNNFHMLCDLQTDTAYPVLDTGKVYHDLNDTLLYYRQSGTNILKLVDKRSLQVLGTRDLGNFISTIPSKLEARNGYFFTRDSSYYHLIRFSDWSLADSGCLHSDVRYWRMFPSDSSLAVASHYTNHAELEVRKYLATPPAVFTGLEFKAMHNSSVITNIDTYPDSSYFVILKGTWDIRVFNHGIQTLDSLKFVISDWGSGHCDWADKVFSFHSLNLQPGDSTEVQVSINHMQSTRGKLKLRLEILPVSANGNIIDKAHLVTGTHNTSIGLPETGTSGLKFYPNPVKDELNLEISSKEHLQVEIRDYSGKLHRQFFFDKARTQEIRLDLSDLPAGVYFVKLRTTGRGAGSICRILKL